EALVRWNSPENGYLPPDSFIPILEQTGYAGKLDFYVYNETFKYLQQLKKEGCPLVPVSLNISRLNHEPFSFVRDFKTLLQKYPLLTPDYIELELEERFAGANDEILKEMTILLQNEGFAVEMDDFGSGESSLNMLSEIPVDVIKFDKRFLRQAESSKESLIILTSMMKMVKELGKTTICEGVETEEQVNILKKIDCDMAQGYFYAKPLLPEDFKKFLLEHI
ncbi:MAG: EAL domain-containing protein, partial [Treponema sp.]|nr:EAL domain-containing protein [Treponema sp.]